MLRDSSDVLHTFDVAEPESRLPTHLLAALARFLLLSDRECALHRFCFMECFLDEWRNSILDGEWVATSSDINCEETMVELDHYSRLEGTQVLSLLFEHAAARRQSQLDEVEVIDELVDDWQQLYFKHATCLGHILLKHNSDSSYISMPHERLLAVHAGMHQLHSLKKAPP